MNIQLLPDLSAMATLLTILYFLRRRHLQEGVGLWIVGLLFIFLEAIAHVFYMRSGPQHIPAHVIALDSYLAAGMIFLWAPSKELFARRPTQIYLIASAIPLAAVQTTYALDVRTPGPYQKVALAGMLVGLIAPFAAAKTAKLGKGWLLIPLQLGLWVAVWKLAALHMYRDTAYFPLFVVYLAVAVLFHRSLPRRSLGRVAIVMGFTVWSLVFLFHSWVTNRPQYISVAAEVWDWQKFLVAIGMLLVMLERQVSSIEWFGLHDQLTGLPNRRLFDQRLEESIARAGEGNGCAAVIMIDLNGFKRINDSHGHEVGDMLLEQISRRLRHAVRSPATLARLGGDEFILVADEISCGEKISEVVNSCRNEIVEALEEPFHVAGEDLVVSASIGSAVYPDDAHDAVTLRRLADQRMYEHKRQTRALVELGAQAGVGSTLV